MQIAAGVPLQCDEPEDFRTFRIGLFGLDKLREVDATVARLRRVVDTVLSFARPIPSFMSEVRMGEISWISLMPAARASFTAPNCDIEVLFSALTPKTRVRTSP